MVFQLNVGNTFFYLGVLILGDLYIIVINGDI